MSRQAIPVSSGASWRGTLSLDAREAMIREAAYYLSLRRGFVPDHDLEDWFAAEAEINHDNLPTNLDEGGV